MYVKRPVILLFVVIAIIALILLIVVIHTSNDGQYPETSKAQADVINLIEIADSLRNSRPDSALAYYHKAIGLLPKREYDKTELTILAKAYNGLSSVFILKGDYPMALEHDSIAMDYAQRGDNKQLQSEALISRGISKCRLGDYDQSLACYERAEAGINRDVDYKNLAKVHSGRAMVYFGLGDYEKVITGFTQALVLGKQHGDKMLIADNYMNLGVFFSNQSQNDSVFVYYDRALSLYEKINDTNGMIRCYTNLGNAYYAVSNFVRAIEYYHMAIELALVLDDKLNLAKAFNNLGDIYIQIGDYDTAAYFLFRAIEVKEQLNNKASLAKGFFGLGKLFFFKKDYSKSEQYFNQSLNINREINNTLQIGSCLNSLASIFSVQNKRDSAIAYYQEVMKTYQQLDYPYGISNVCINLADEYKEQKRYDESEQLLLKALELRTTMTDEDGVGIVNFHLANLYLAKSGALLNCRTVLLAKAEERGLKAFKIASRIGVLPLKRDASKCLKSIYEKQGLYQKSLEYSELFNALSDSVLNKANIEALANAEARWNAEKKQKEIDNLKETTRLNQEIIDRKEKESGQQKLIIWFVVILFVLTLISVAIAILYIRKRSAMAYQKQLAKMTALRMQNVRNAMSPHFFFNVLGTISGLSSNQEILRAKLHNLSLLLRKVIENIDRLAVPLNDEMSTVKAFIDLSRDQIQAPFEVVYQVAEHANLNRLVPAMLVQIPVENAIKHGLKPLEGDKKLVINISDFEDYLRISVVDNGIGLQAASTHVSTGTGTGLKALMQTIHLLNLSNQKKIKFSIKENQPDHLQQTGTSVEIFVPHNFNYTMLAYDYGKN